MISKKPLICFILPSLRSGGAEKIISVLINYWNRDKYTIRVILVDSRDRFFKLNREYEVIEIHKHSPKQAAIPLFLEIRKMKPDWVFVSTMKYATLCGYLSLILPNSIHWICRESNISSLSYSSYYRFPRLMKLLAKIAYKKMDHIIAQSEYMKKDFLDFFKTSQQNITVINNPIQFERKEWKKTMSKSKRLLSVGRLNKVKGYDRILPQIARLDFDYTYTILGDGPERKLLEGLIISLGIENKVEFKGQVNNVEDYYENSDVLLMASRHEGFPNVLLEAGIHGIPVVAMNCPGGTAEIVHHGTNGYLVDDIEEYADYVKKVYQNEWDAKGIKRATQKKYEIKTILSQYYKIINNEVIN
ncbi:MAG: glycosyltransferase [Saprospiraceae bacterium]|nr:glycosyltransferase [Saprospiraceae bacterium]